MAARKRKIETSGNSDVKKHAEGEDGSFNVNVHKKEMYWIIGAMAFVLTFLLVSAYLVKSTNSFTYQSLKFTKQTYGTIPVFVYGYNFKDITGNAVKEFHYDLLLRLDPRKNMIPVKGEIEFPYGREVYVSVNTTGLQACQNTARDLATLSGFLTVNLFNVHGGVPDAEEAEKNNLTHITCETFPDATVLMIQEGNTTSIEKREGGCYVLNVANCETLDIVEKFEVRALIDAKKKKST